MTDVRSSPEFDAARLATRIYLTGQEAAFYMGYTRPTYKNPYQAFFHFMQRNRIPHAKVGRRLLFKRADLDARLTLVRDAQLAAARG